ncbi:hypothetical protein AJ80_08812 [Polytolypa hystricis UAMH7299]|uniref:Uncharacterized protein n=1 Tax=Polytolypa hystricis (strain UAMH7299) TaxID=1447883 RepID=A0A2B7X1B7_POLH7|nr:hypothetical protein AJ80_08812 [Polytolypa hystricis UAMH7299]
MSCSFDPNSYLVGNVTFGQFNESMADPVECPEAYLRPDPGGALIPWLYALFLLLFHLPACIIRAVRWESAQYLALGLAVLGIALCIQTYYSTHMEAAEVLVWMPLTLSLDVGAMMQMVVLIIEAHGISDLTKALKGACLRFWGGIAATFFGIKYHLVQPPLGPADQEKAPSESRTKRDVLRHAVVAVFSFVFLIMLVILQLYGLAAAAKGKKQHDLRVKWCSPAFRDFALAITTGGCDKYAINESRSNGIGCIKILAQDQRLWLTGTIIGLSAGLVFQVLDMALLRMSKGRKCRGVKMQRPWLTMFSGILILVILIAFSVFNANQLPGGITDVVWIYRKEPDVTVGRVCKGTLKSPGLRGMIIGWTDGLFDGWGSVYHGTITQAGG